MHDFPSSRTDSVTLVEADGVNLSVGTTQEAFPHCSAANATKGFRYAAYEGFLRVRNTEKRPG